jgi:hypothetical protein
MTVKASETDTCPHCGVVNRFEGTAAHIYAPGRAVGTPIIVGRLTLEEAPANIRNTLEIARCTNPDCRLLTMIFEDKMVVPLASTRPQAPSEVPPAIAEDYLEACLVEGLSAKSAAALARRCLQNLLNDKGITGAGRHTLDDQITQAISTLPSDLADNIDAIRVVGNFAAHPNKSTHTGDIVEVEPEEAGYILDVLFDLFDFYYVRPARSRAKKAALQAKLTAAGSNVQIK